MWNIPKKGWIMWGIVILTLILNVVIIKIANNNQVLLWLLIISSMLLILAVYSVFQGKQFLLSFIKGSRKSFTERSEHEFLSHSIYPTKITKDDLRVTIGNDQCSKPFNASLLSIEACKNTNYRFSHAELNKPESENLGRLKLSSINKFIASAVGPIWQIDATYQGCRLENGNFDTLAFQKIASKPGVKMIEINLNSPFNQEYWGNAPLGVKKYIGIKGTPDLFTCSGYTTFRDAEGLLHFIESLRILSGGKPIGFRLSINDKKDFRKICHAIRKTQIIPDFIVITGSSEKTAYSHSDILFPHDMPLYEALIFVSQTIRAYGLDEDIKVIAAGKVDSGFDMLKMLALGANPVCVDSNCFNTPEVGNRYEIKPPYGNNNIHYRLMKEFVQLMNVGGFRSIKDVTLSKFLSGLDVLHPERYSQKEEPFIFRGAAKKVSNDKINEIEFEKGKSLEKALLQ